MPISSHDAVAWEWDGMGWDGDGDRDGDGARPNWAHWSSSTGDILTPAWCFLSLQTPLCTGPCPTLHACHGFGVAFSVCCKK